MPLQVKGIAFATRWKYALALAGCWFGLLGAAQGETSPAPAAKRVGVLTDNFPFSFRDSSGKVDGFAYELTTEIAQVMGLHLERVEGTNAEISSAFHAGRVDLLQSYAQFPERESFADFSVPYLTMRGAIFVRQDEARIESLADLKGRKVLVHVGSLGETVLQREGLAGSIVHVGSVEEALAMLDRGEGDATLLGRLSGLAMAYHQGLRRVRVLDTPVAGYDVRYCLAVREGDRETLSQLNEGLAILVRTGRFEEIYRRWFGHIEPVGYTREQVMLAVATGLAVALLVALWAVVRLRRLRARLARKAEVLRISEERHRAVFDGANEGLLVLERLGPAPDYLSEQVNLVAQRLLGLDKAPLAGTGLAAMLGADAPLIDRVHPAASQGRVEEFEYERAAGAGWWRVSVSPLGAKTLLSLTDITEAIQARQQLRRQEEQLQNIQKLEAIGTLAGGIAHDFNNLLTAIMGNTELCLMGLPAAQPETENLRQVMLAAGRARQLVQQILTFSRQREASQEVLTVSPIVEETLVFLRSVARGSVEFEFKRQGALPAIVADSSQLHQVLMNIGTNAVQAMHGTPGRLTFVEELVTVAAAERALYGALRPGRYVRIGIQDTGPGMTPQVQARIFEPFFTTKAEGEGTGLGLSVVHGIMQQHGGAVTVYSQPGKGTLFHLYFPVASTETITLAMPEPAAVPTGHGERVLLVDDEGAILKIVEQILIRLGYRVSAHVRPTDALAEFAARPADFALVLSDLTMPGLNGLQLAAQIRALCPHQPFILSSGFFSSSEEEQAAALRIGRLLHKPLSYAALGQAVAASLPPTVV